MSTLERHSPVILYTLRSRCGEWLRSIADELQGNQDERALRSGDEPTPHSGLIKYLLYVLDAHHEKATLSRLTSSRTLTERLRELHDGIDPVVNLLNQEHSDKLCVQWEKDWEQDLTTHWELLHHAVKNTELIRSELAGRELIEALTEIKFETKYRADNYAPEHIELLTQTFVAVARMSRKGAAVYKTPKWFIPRDLSILCTVARGGKVMHLVVKNFGVESVGKRQLFAKEIERWSCFDHSHVIKLYGANHVSTPGVLVMEDVTSENFIDYFRGFENKQYFWGLFYQAALGVQYLFRERQAHGNLKCSNLKCSNLKCSKDGAAKISDFCLSSLTNRWKPLECIQGSETPTSKFDVYSLDMCIIEAAIGEPPWDGEDDNLMLNSLLDGTSYPHLDEVFPNKQWTLVNDFVKIKVNERLDLDAAVDRLKDLADEEEREVLLKRTSGVRICFNCQFSVIGDQDLCDQCGSPLPADSVRHLRVLVRDNKKLTVEEKFSLVDGHIFKLALTLKKEMVTRQLWGEHPPKMSMCDECGEASSFDSNFCCDCGADLENL